MPDKQAAALMAIESLEQRTSFLERALDTGLSLEECRRAGNESLEQRTSFLERALDAGLSLEECRRAGNGAQWAYEKILDLPGAAEPQSFVQEGCPDNQLALQPHSEASPSTLLFGGGGLGLPLMEARRMSACGSRVGILPKALSNLTGPLRHRVRRGLPGSSILAQLVGSLRETRDT